jgi:hypothetical protein
MSVVNKYPMGVFDTQMGLQEKNHHMAVASNSYTHTTWLRFCHFGSLVEST